jgi:hypothetical protein
VEDQKHSTDNLRFKQHMDQYKEDPHYDNEFGADSGIHLRRPNEGVAMQQNE